MTGVLTFWFNAGAAVRGAAKREVETYCFDRRLECEITESKSLFSSRYFVTITGERDLVIAAKADLEEWSRRMAA